MRCNLERGFICAETVGWDDLVKPRPVNTARGQGLMSPEGIEYVVSDRDILPFRLDGQDGRAGSSAPVGCHGSATSRSPGFVASATFTARAPEARV